MFRTERLVIKPYSDDDQARMTELLTDERIRKTFMVPDLKSPEKAAAMFEKLKRWSYSGGHYEKGIYLDGTLIGFINDVEISGGVIEVGYVIHPDFQNRGFATETLSAAIRDLFQNGYTEVRAAAFTGNKASRRVMEKCGMRLTGETSEVRYRGRLRKCVHYAITRDGHASGQEGAPLASGD